MNELQITLAATGAAIIAGIYLFNRFQERKYRRKSGQDFGGGHGDAPEEDFAAAGGGEPRVEPRWDSAPPLPPQQAAADEPRPATDFSSALDCVVEISATQPIAEQTLAELLRNVRAPGKPVRCSGADANGVWKEIGDGANGGNCVRLRLALQLADRAGPASEAQLRRFCETVRACAAQSGGEAHCPDLQAALAAAAELDRFCAETDVTIGLNIMGTHFLGTKIRALAEAAGFKLENDGLFHCRDEHGRTLYTLGNMEPAPFSPDQIRTMSTGGVTLLFDVALAPDGLRVFNQMTLLARNMAASLGGKLVDDNRAPLNEAGIEQIRKQLRVIYAAMEQRGIEPGGERALQLFS